MRIVPILIAAVAATVALPAVANAQETPFPSPKVQQVFVAAQTVTTQRAMITQVAPGATVVFRAYAVDGKTRNVIAAKDHAEADADLAGDVGGDHARAEVDDSHRYSASIPCSNVTLGANPRSWRASVVSA